MKYRKTNIALRAAGMLALLGGINPASHAFSGNQFLEKCDGIHQAPTEETVQEAVNRALDAGTCSGFVGGVIQGVNLVGNMLRAQDAIARQFICLPQGTQAAQLLEAVLVDLRKRPDDIGAPVELHIYRSVGTRYPCEESTN